MLDAAFADFNQTPSALTKPFPELHRHSSEPSLNFICRTALWCLKGKNRSQCFSFFTMSFSQSIAVKLHFSLQQHYIVTTVTVITAYLYLLYTYNYSCLYKVKNALHFNISVCAYLSKCKYLKVQVQFMSSKCLTLWKNCKANTCAVSGLCFPDSQACSKELVHTHCHSPLSRQVWKYCFKQEERG